MPDGSADIDAYKKLQEHLDTLPVGFPRSKSGAEIRILKFIFTAKEAQIATKLSASYETAQAVHTRARELGMTVQELEQALDKMVSKGGINVRKEDVRHSQIEEVERVGVDILPDMFQFPEELRGSRGIHAVEGVAGFGGGEVVADGADAAHAGGDVDGFFDGAVGHEAFEAAEVHDVEVGVGDVAFGVELDGDGAVAFDAGDGGNLDDVGLGLSLSGFGSCFFAFLLDRRGLGIHCLVSSWR